MRRSGPLTLAVILAVPSFARAATWEIDPAHSTAQFRVKHLMISTVTGEFAKVTGAVNYDPDDVTRSSVEATIDSTTINTRVADRDNHLKSPDFLDVAKHPAITFKSRRVEKAGAGKLKVTGDLTIRGVTKEVVLDVEGPTPEIKDPWGNVKAGASATTRVNRQDFGVAWNKALEGGGLVVGNDVAIIIEVELLKKK